MRGSLRRFSVIATAAGLALTLGASAAQAAAAPQWRVSYRSHSANADPLSSVVAISRGDAWSVGVTSYPSGATRPLVLHWNGSSWGKLTIPGSSGFQPFGVAASSATDVWIFGSLKAGGDEAMIWSGHSWTSLALPASFGGPIAVLGRSNVWADNSDNCTGNSCTTTVWHWNGATWTSVQVSGEYEDLASAGGRVWILALTNLRNLSSGDPTGKPVIYRTNGAALQRVSAPSQRLWDFAHLAASPSGQLWLLGNPGYNRNTSLLFHYAGGRWTDTKVPAHVGSKEFVLEDPFIFDGHSGVWAGAYAHWTGSQWVNAFQVSAMPGNDGFGLLDIAAIPGSASIWGVGSAGKSPSNSTKDSLIGLYGATP
jgi:hypothetical protein